MHCFDQNQLEANQALVIQRRDYVLIPGSYKFSGSRVISPESKQNRAWELHCEHKVPAKPVGLEVTVPLTGTLNLIIFLETSPQRAAGVKVADISLPDPVQPAEGRHSRDCTLTF